MARLYCSPRSISVSSLSRCDCMATRGSSIYRVMATTLAIRKMSSRAKPPWFLRRKCLRRTTGVLRDLHSLFAFDIGVFDDHRLGIDAHDFVALLHGHALVSEDDIFAIQEERGLLAIDALGGKTIILHGDGWGRHDRRRTGRRGRFLGAHSLPYLGHDFLFRPVESGGHQLRLTELKQIALGAIQSDPLFLCQEIQAQGGIDGQRVDLIFLAFGAQRGMKLVAAGAAGAAQLARRRGRLGRGQRRGNGGGCRAHGFGGGAFPLGGGGRFGRDGGRGGIGEEVAVDKVGRHHAEHGERPDRLLVLGAELHSPAPCAAVAGGAAFRGTAALSGAGAATSGSGKPNPCSFTKVSTFTVTLRICPVCCGAATMLSMIRKRGDLSTRLTNLESAA